MSHPVPFSTCIVQRPLSNMDIEKGPLSPDHHTSMSFSDAGKDNKPIDLEQLGEREGYVLDTSLAQQEGLKTTPDGKTVLIPQPSESPNDPLNWSSFRKHLILIIISAAAFLPDYGSATGAVTLIPQAAYVPTLIPDFPLYIVTNSAQGVEYD